MKATKQCPCATLLHRCFVPERTGTNGKRYNRGARVWQDEDTMLSQLPTSTLTTKHPRHDRQTLDALKECNLRLRAKHTWTALLLNATHATEHTSKKPTNRNAHCNLCRHTNSLKLSGVAEASVITPRDETWARDVWSRMCSATTLFNCLLVANAWPEPVLLRAYAAKTLLDAIRAILPRSHPLRQCGINEAAKPWLCNHEKACMKILQIPSKSTPFRRAGMAEANANESLEDIRRVSRPPWSHACIQTAAAADRHIRPKATKTVHPGAQTNSPPLEGIGEPQRDLKRALRRESGEPPRQLRLANEGRVSERGLMSHRRAHTHKRVASLKRTESIPSTLWPRCSRTNSSTWQGWT